VRGIGQRFLALLGEGIGAVGQFFALFGVQVAVDCFNAILAVRFPGGFGSFLLA
jgi:hypothetical protein